MAKSFRELEVWKRSIDLTALIYELTTEFQKHEIYGLTSQMRRAAVSIASNIAEGKGKSSDRDFSVFLYHARASLHELETQALIAERLRYWEGDTAAAVKSLTAETGKMLNGLINSMRQNDQAKRFKTAG